MVKKFTSDFKAQVAITALKGHKTVNEIATEFEVHATQINLWKKQLLEGSKGLFSGKNEKDAELMVQERDRLYTQIGQLTVELNWLKKKVGHLD